MIPLHRFSVWFLLFPRLFLNTEYTWDEFDIVSWSATEYEYQADPLFGLWDIVQPVPETLTSGAGDCDDYALVAASYLYATTDHEISLGVHIGVTTRPGKGHLTVYDHTAEKVYSSGVIYPDTFEEFTARSEYDLHFRRSIRGA